MTRKAHIPINCMGDRGGQGGFWHVREATYMLLAAMEEEVREHFQVGAVDNTQEGCRKKTNYCCK